MKNLFFLFLILFSVKFIYSQTLFPDRCIGVWHGTMALKTANNSVDSVAVDFTVAKTDTPNVWIWRTRYLSQSYPLTKDYRLKLKDKNENTFVIDELDGIQLECKVYDQVMLSLFSVEKQMLACRYELLGETLIFEIFTGKPNGTSTSGIEDYSIFSLQRVVLKRK